MLERTHTCGQNARSETMIWFFGRDEEELRVDTRYDNDTAEFLLVICGPDGEQSERFTDIAEFRSRLVEVENRLEAERWHRTRDPAIVPDGLPRRPLM